MRERRIILSRDYICYFFYSVTTLCSLYDTGSHVTISFDTNDEILDVKINDLNQEVKESNPLDYNFFTHVI